MSDITLTYKDSVIATLDDTGSKTIKTQGKYCEGDITLDYVKPSGGPLQPKSGIEPTKSSQTITPDAGYYGLSSVQIDPIGDEYQDVSGVTATASDVLESKVIVDSDGEEVTGTMTNNGTITETIDGFDSVSYTLPTGYVAGGTVSLTDAIAERLSRI